MSLNSDSKVGFTHEEKITRVGELEGGFKGGRAIIKIRIAPKVRSSIALPKGQAVINEEKH
ncbi:MAG: hypothetical protein PF517_15940 [Salinivirgaceae bacterium]|jgi:hypothetical protein|nr:hypothetical protein [Salinivirgaceae bacterium]